MKTKAINVTIPRPCSQDWAEMETISGHNFCKACEKTVVDFTGYTNAAIVQALLAAKGDRICGRLSSRQLAQLDYYLIPTDKRWSWSKHLGILAIGTAFFMAGCGKKPLSEKPMVHQIYGYVTDENREPLSGISVNIADTKLAAVTDKNGKYEITSSQPFNEQRNILMVHSRDYNEILSVDYKKQKQDTLVLREQDYMILGEIALLPVPQDRSK